MTLRSLGEDDLISSLLSRLPVSVTLGGSVRAGAGEDDCAVVRPPKGRHWQLLKTDCLVESVHFASGAAPESVGWKALCRPLSDIAATGGKPLHALITLAMPADTPLNWAQSVYLGIGRAAHRFGVKVVGGETASSPGPCFISICLTGSVRRDRCVTRSGGRTGDLLYVTGELGGSFASGRHLSFQPRLREARWLVAHHAVRAMMDLSDGLAADLPRLARASGTGYTVDRDRLPCSPGCGISQALGDGEDYELLFALAPRDASRLERAWKRKFPSLPLTVIGCLAEPGTVLGLEDAHGYDHFAAR